MCLRLHRVKASASHPMHGRCSATCTTNHAPHAPSRANDYIARLLAVQIEEVQIPVDHITKKPRGFGFVRFESTEDAEAATDNMDQSELGGRVIRVNPARGRRSKLESSRAVWDDVEGNIRDEEEVDGGGGRKETNADPAAAGNNAP
jgi:RNA recognition motif-containing protein